MVTRAARAFLLKTREAKRANTTRPVPTAAALERAFAPKRSIECWIYAIGPEGGRPIKIGATGRSVEARRQSMQTGVWFDLHIFWAAQVSGSKPCAALEARVHHALAASRIRGEWFLVTSEEARAAFLAAAEASAVPFSWVEVRGHTNEEADF